MRTANSDTPKRLAVAQSAALGLTALAGLFLISRHNFLFFHGLTELFSIAVAWSLFLLVWSSRRNISNDALLFIGIAYGFIGLMDLVHTLAYKGMGVFPPAYSANTATQLWIAARGMEGLTLLLFPALLRKHRLSGGYVFWGFAVLTAALLGSIFLWDLFPECFIEGQGLTAFKKAAEYVICLALILSMVLLYFRRAHIDVDVFCLMASAMGATVMAELVFTFYISVYGLSNVTGHLFKIISFYLVYLALVRATVVRPQATVFQELERNRADLAEKGRHLRLLHQTSSLFLESGALDDTISVLPQMIADHYAAPIVAIELYDAERHEMVFVGAVGIPKAEDGRLRVPVDQTVSGAVVTSGRAVIDLDVSDHADYRAGALKELGVVTFACVPLSGREGVIGTLAIADREIRPDIQAGTDLLQALADFLVREIERHRQAGRLRESEEKYRALFSKNRDGYVINKGSGEILDPNPAFARMLGYNLQEIKTVSFWDLTPDKWVEWERDVQGRTLLERGYTDLYEKEYIRKDGTVFPIEVQAFLLNDPGNLNDALIGAFVRDITEHKQAESEREHTLRMLEILNAKTELRDLMQALLGFMLELSGCTAVGIRLRDGDDFPYYETRGFADKFVEAERYLCARDLHGQLLRDEVGNPVLECMCGNIICGRFDPALPFFTDFGSFVSNGTSRLLATTTEEERQARTRNRCNAEGYESVMLVPLRSGNEPFGLLQFNDRREGRFTPRFVAQVERMAGNVAIALAQRKTDAVLKESLERLKGFDLHSSEGVYRVDMARPVPLDLAPEDMRALINRHAVVGDVNDALARMYGLTSKDMIGRPATDFAPDYGLRALRVLDRADRRVINEETEDVDKDGNPLYLIENYHGVVADGHLHAIWGAQRDITDRKRAETALEEERRRLADIIEGTHVGTWEWNVQTGETVFNERWAEIIGYSLDEISPASIETWRKCTHPDDLKASDELLESHFRGERDYYECEARMKHKNGAWVWILDRGRVVSRTDDGRPLMMTGTHQDITDRKTAEKDIWESNERLQKVFDSQLDAIFVLDAQSPPRVVSCNKAAGTIFGYAAEELQGATTEMFHVDKARLGQFQRVLATAVDTEGYLQDFEFDMKRKDGSMFPSRHTVWELTDDTGARTGWVSIVGDLTERKKMEARLLQAQKMESIGTLAGGIAHDFNNILFPIIGMSELLLEDLAGDSLEYENATEILKAGKRGRDLVQQILAFSRQTEHKMIPVRPQQILKEVVKLTRSTIPSNIKISQWLQKDCDKVLADPTQLHQVGMNLVTNAYHAVEHNDGSISIQLKEMDIGAGDLADTPLPPGRHARLTVSDTGPGIAPEHIDKIFDPYFTTKAQGKGTGLGLAVVYGIIQEHGGDITVATEIGKGTKFHVYLPLIAEAAEQDATDSLEILATGHERILLVDDETAVLSLEKQMLERLGYRVTAQNSSAAVLKLFSADPAAFDLVISDMTMPDITGDKLARQLMDIRPDIPIVICTGFSERIDKEKAAAIGIKGLLPKPIVRSKLAETVRKALNDAKGIPGGK